MTVLSIPSPSTGVWEIGPFPLRGYALCIVLGIVVAVWVGERRWKARGGTVGEIQDIALWAVPFGIVGARLYHVITDHQLYFGEGQSAWNALYVWRGGLGIWGGIAFGALGAILAARRKGIRIAPLLDVLAPTCLLAQAIGRWGNWFNQELYGKPTDLPWGLEIAAENLPPGSSYPEGTLFHPTFLYECLWNLAAFAAIVWLERRFRIGHGRVLALYVMAYTLGRGWIEMLRIDPVQIDDVLGLRLNVWTSIVLFVLAAAYFAWSARRHPGREDGVYDETRPARTGDGTGTDDSGTPDSGTPDSGTPDSGTPDSGTDAAARAEHHRRSGDDAGADADVATDAGGTPD